MAAEGVRHATGGVLGSKLEPQLRSPGGESRGGFGLHMVEEMSSAWGVTHDRAGATRVWCELPLPSAPACP